MITVKAHAKINWALNITGLREDGYHLLDMVIQQIELHDTMTFIDAAAGITLTNNGKPTWFGQHNLIVRAARALNEYTGADHGARVDLVKRIPFRAGLGGGSADCAMALRAFNQLWKLGLSDETLLDIGLKLGADVPYCMTGGLARVTGIGEHIEAVPSAPGIPLVLVTPGNGLSTTEVFGLWDQGRFPAVELDAPALVRAVSLRDLDAVDRLCANALTAPAVSMMPEIARIIDGMRRHGARAAFMTGSGSTVVGAFDDEDAARRAAEAFEGAILTRTL